MRLMKIEDSSGQRTKETSNPHYSYVRSADTDVSRSVTVLSTSDDAQSQYINIQRVPEINSSKAFTSLLNGNELLVDANGELINSSALDRYITQYEGDLMQDDLTDDDRRLAAALVAVQLVNQQKQQSGPHSLALLPSSTTSVANSKQSLSESTVISMPALSGPNKISTSVSPRGNVVTSSQSIPGFIQSQSSSQILVHEPMQPLPPLKKVLSRSEYLRSSSSIAPSTVPLEALGLHTEMDSMDIDIHGTEGIKQDMEFMLPDDGKGHYDSEDESELPDSDYDLSEDSRRQSLPHKKRIARRLRQPKKKAANPRSKKASAFGKRLLQTGATQTTLNRFSCELCSQSFNNQLTFFEHLKRHYEPILVGDTVMPSLHLGQPHESSDVMATEASKNKTPRPPSGRVRILPPNPRPIAVTNVRSLSTTGPVSTPKRLVTQRVNPPIKDNPQKVITMAANAKANNPPVKLVRSKPVAQVQNPSSNRWTAAGGELHDIINAAPILYQQLQGTVVQTLWECQPCKRIFKRQKTFESHMAAAHFKDEPVEEFSEPEDMMEGIKVQVASDEEKDVPIKESILQRVWYDGTDLDVTVETIKNEDEMPHGEVHTETDLCVLNDAADDFKSEEVHGPSNTEAVDEGTDESRTCVMCREVFPTKVQMKQHISSVHGDIVNSITKNVRKVPAGTAKKGDLVCTQCGRKFHHRNSLLYHTRSHAGERAHTCEVCGKGFFAKSALKVHMRQHSGAKPYKCDFCNRFFRQWGDLKYHVISIHSDQRNYQCEYCGKDFARKYSLTVHSRIHTGERNYKCEFCTKTFRAATYLQNHRRVHTGEKPYVCEICSKPFRVRSDMKRHMATHRDSSFAKTSASANKSAHAKFISEASDDHLVINEIEKVEELEVSTVEGILSEESNRAASRIQDELQTAFIPRDGPDSQREQNTLYFWQVFPT